MTPPPPFAGSASPDRARLAEEAATWLVLLAEDPDDRDVQARLEAWCGRSDLHREVWERTRRAYGHIGDTAPAHRDHWQVPGRAIPASTNEPLPPGHPLWRPIRLVGAAMALGLAVWLGAATIPSVLTRLQADHVTATAELRVLNLDDGSRVRLAPESAIEVAFTDGERRTRLLAGEAFFEVTPNLRRPFRVVAGEVTTTVLGTEFEVRLGKDGTAVVVREGQVRVDDNARSGVVSVELRAGDALQVAAKGGLRRSTLAADEVAAWTAGKVIARDRPIGEVVDRLRSYYNGMIVVQDGKFSGLRVSGIYDLADPVATLRDLADTHGAKLRQISPWLLVVTSR